MRPWIVALLLIGSRASATTPPEIRPGVWAAREPETLPLPMRGYEAYLVGEMHGMKENTEFQLSYLEQLHRASGLRDIAIEERAAYENEAQAFVAGRSDAMPSALCLRAGLLDGIRRLNMRLKAEERIRIHLTDIDSPAAAIRAHLGSLQQRLGASGAAIPSEADVGQRGLETVARLKSLNTDAATRSELRTIELSILSLRQGLEFDLGPSKGSPYLDSREEAVASNIVDLLRVVKTPSLLVVYGVDHVSRTPRKDGGPNRNQPFLPMALRLEQAGIAAFTLMTLPLQGRTFWRGHSSDIFWTPADGRLSSGETLDKILASASDAQFLYIDPKRERVRLPAEDHRKMAVDAVLLFRSGEPLRDTCRSR
jgi:hypothetical protein